MTPQAMTSICGYIIQEDLFIGTLTVKEHLTFLVSQLTHLAYKFRLQCTGMGSGEVPQITTSPQSTSPRKWGDLAPGTGPQYRSLLCLSRKNRTSRVLQVLNFRGLVWTAGTVLPVLPIPEWW